MPANVDKTFERGVSALFGSSAKVAPEREKPQNIFRLWNTFAVKFPSVYEFASTTRHALSMEEKLCAFHKLDFSSKEGRAKLADMFASRIEFEKSVTLEGALENWWKEVSRD